MTITVPTGSSLSNGTTWRIYLASSRTLPLRSISPLVGVLLVVVIPGGGWKMLNTEVAAPAGNGIGGGEGDRRGKGLKMNGAWQAREAAIDG